MTDVALRMSRSLEANGSPAPYLESALNEKKRLEGKGIRSFPVDFTEERVRKVLASWKGIEGPLQLREFTKASGRDIRYGIQGHWQKSIPELVAKEARLSDGEKKRYEMFLKKEKFQREDFAAMEAFYSNEWDRLSQQGRDQMGRRLNLGMSDFDGELESKEKLARGTVAAEILREYEKRVRGDLARSSKSSWAAEDLRSVLKKGILVERPANMRNNWYYLDAKSCYLRVKNGSDARRVKVAELMPADAARRVVATLDEMTELLSEAVDSEFKGMLMERK